MLAIEGMNGMVPDIPEDDSAFWNEVLSVPAILLKIKNRISDAVADALYYSPQCWHAASLRRQ